MLSIVHVLSSFGVGGQERIVLDLALGQRARGHAVAVVSLAPPPDGEMAAEFHDHGITPARVAKRRGFDPGLIGRLARTVHALRAQIVHTHNPLPLIYGAPAARLAGAVAIHTKHGANPGSTGQRVLRRTAARLTHAFVAVSEATAAQAIELRDAPASRLRVIENGIRLQRFRPDSSVRETVREELGLGGAWVVGTVGRLDAWKNQAMLVRAMAPMLSASVRLVIVGDGPERASLERAIATLPEPRWVVVTGRRMDVPRLVAALDVFALPSSSEGLPLVIPEAMAAGVPIVATAVGGVPSLVDEGRTGLLVPVAERPLREALRALEADRARARMLGAAAREVALARFGADRMIEAYLELYAAHARC